MSIAYAECAANIPPAVDSRDALPLRIETRDSSGRAAMMALWQSLELKLGHARLTSSSIWVETWLKHFGSKLCHQFLIAFRGLEAVGICLVTESSEHFGPVTIRTLHIGTAGEPETDSVCVEFNSLLIGEADRTEFIGRIQQHLEIAKADAIAWEGFDPKELPVDLQSGKCWHKIARQTRYFDLDCVREADVELISKLGDSTRKSIRQNLRDLGKVKVDWSETPQQVDEYYTELIALHQSRWEAAGEPGVFASRPFREFHEELLLRLVPLGGAAMVRVRAGNQTIGCTLLHIDQSRALVYQGGWASDSAKSPGVVNDYCCLLECLRRGLSAYDFMAGDSIHKHRMTTHQGKLVWTTRRLSTWKFNLIDGLRSAKRWFRMQLASGKDSL